MAFARDGSGRVAVSFIGEGGSSLGEWHEAINLCAARRLPAIFCVAEQPDRAVDAGRRAVGRARVRRQGGRLRRARHHDRRHRSRRDRRAFAWAAERARAGLGPALIELVAMRMCGHAHHDDMLYLGSDPQPSWDYPPLDRAGLRRTASSTSTGRRAIRSRATPRSSRRDGIIEAGDLDRFKREAEAIVEERGARGDRRAVARARAGRRRRVRERAAARRTSRCSIPRSGSQAAPARRRRDVGLPLASSRRRRSIRRAARSSKPSCSASATRCAPIRACSSTARTSAASTATRSCCCGRC